MGTSYSLKHLKYFFYRQKDRNSLCVLLTRIIQTFISIPKPTAVKTAILQQGKVTFASFYVIHGNGKKAVKIVTSKTWVIHILRNIYKIVFSTEEKEIVSVFYSPKFDRLLSIFQNLQL